MRIKDGYLLRVVADTYIVVPVAERVIEFKGMMTINELAAAIWEFMHDADRSYDDILNHILSLYEVDIETAGRDLDKLLEQMQRIGVLEP